LSRPVQRDTNTKSTRPSKPSDRIGIAAWASHVSPGSPSEPIPLPEHRPVPTRKVVVTSKSPRLCIPQLLHRQTSVSPTLCMSTPDTTPISASVPIQTPQQHIASLSSQSRSMSYSTSPALSPVRFQSLPSSTPSASTSTSMTSPSKYSTFTPVQSMSPHRVHEVSLFKEKSSRIPNQASSPSAKAFTVLAMAHRPYIFPEEDSDDEAGSVFGTSYIPSSLLEKNFDVPAPSRTSYTRDPRQLAIPIHSSYRSRGYPSS
jgi:hypothetical protein